MPRHLNIACRVTLLRLLLIPLALLAAHPQWQHGLLLAAGICAVAGLTDVLDGFLARRNNCITPLGSFLDLVADKLFVSAMLIVLAALGTIPYWVPAIVIAREIAISTLRLRRLMVNRPIDPDRWGKAKMVLTMVAIVGLLLRQGFQQDGLVALAGIPAAIYPLLDLSWWAMLLAVALTIFSGAKYCVSYLGPAQGD